MTIEEKVKNMQQIFDTIYNEKRWMHKKEDKINIRKW